MSHEKLETNVGLMAIGIAIVIAIGGLAEIVPLMYQAETIKPLPGVKPYPALELAGGVKSRAAELLSLNRTTLVEKMRRLGLSS